MRNVWIFEYKGLDLSLQYIHDNLDEIRTIGQLLLQDYYSDYTDDYIDDTDEDHINNNPGLPPGLIPPLMQVSFR